MATAVTELNGTSEVATYGPPYNNTPGAGQKVLGVNTQTWPGVHYRIDTARDFVLDPLRSIPGNAPLQRALSAYSAASKAQQKRWTDAYTAGLKRAHFPDGLPKLSPGNYGPLAPMMSSLAGLAESGGLDGALLTSSQFYQTNYTKPLLFLSGGDLFRVPRRRPAPARRPVGDAERDRQLPVLTRHVVNTADRRPVPDS